MYSLAFYFYCTKDWKNNRAIQLHLKCLEKYSKLFSRALFILSIDDTSDTCLLMDIEKAIINLGFKNIKFVIHRNDIMCEVSPFLDEIIDWVKDSSGMTFYGHTKGTTNYKQWPSDCIDKWIVGAYYLSLNFVKEAEHFILKNWAWAFFGSFLEYWPVENYGENFPNKFNNLYSGTFFWMNNTKVANWVKTHEINRNFRHCIEFLPGEIGSWDIAKTGTMNLASHQQLVKYAINFDLYLQKDWDGYFLTEDEIPAFEEFCHEIIDS